MCINHSPSLYQNHCLIYLKKKKRSCYLVIISYYDIAPSIWINCTIYEWNSKICKFLKPSNTRSIFPIMKHFPSCEAFSHLWSIFLIVPMHSLLYALSLNGAFFFSDSAGLDIHCMRITNWKLNVLSQNLIEKNSKITVWKGGGVFDWCYKTWNHTSQLKKSECLIMISLILWWNCKTKKYANDNQ